LASKKSGNVKEYRTELTAETKITVVLVGIVCFSCLFGLNK